MIRLLLLTLVLASAVARPVQEENDDYETDPAEKVQGQDDVTVFIKKFKVTMAMYARALYTHLTKEEVMTVMAHFDVFLQQFVEDVKEILYDEDYRRLREVEKVDDGMSKEFYDDIKSKVKAEFKGADDEMTEEIMFRIRKNLLSTRKKVEQVIRAHFEGPLLSNEDSNNTSIEQQISN